MRRGTSSSFCSACPRRPNPPNPQLNALFLESIATCNNKNRYVWQNCMHLVWLFSNQQIHYRMVYATCYVSNLYIVDWCDMSVFGFFNICNDALWSCFEIEWHSIGSDQILTVGVMTWKKRLNVNFYFIKIKTEQGTCKYRVVHFQASQTNVNRLQRR